MMVFVEQTTGATRPMEMGDLYNMVAPINLGLAVPANVREQFDKALNALRGLSRLIERALAEGYLNRDDFTANGVNTLDFLPRMRNELAHGSTHLLPSGTPDVLELCADIISKLFAV